MATTTIEKRTTGSGSGRARLATLAAALLLIASGCTTNRRVELSSTPAGARILIDGVDSGQQTPSSVVLSTSKPNYVLTLEKGGFNPVSREVALAKDVDVIGPGEAVCSICMAPCCFGLSLLRLLHPVDVETKFVPERIDATLAVAGQRARLQVKPAVFETYLHGKLVSLFEGNYLVTSVGDHELEIRAPGHRSFSRSIRVDDRVYQRVEVELEVEGQGLLVTGSPAGAKVLLDDQFQGNLGEEPRRVRTEPGPHLLRVELDGYKPWQDVVQVEADRYHEVTIDLKLEGQGIRVRKPEGLAAKTPEIQVLVDGQLQGSAFDQPVRLEPGDHDVEIRVTGRETRRIEVRIAKDTWLDLEPGPRTDGRGKPQVVLDHQGVRVMEPEDFDDELDPADLQILIDGSLRTQEFGRVIPLEPGEYTLDIRAKGYESWTQRIKVTRKQVLDVWPALRRM